VIKFDDGNCETDLCSSESFPSVKKQMIMQAMIFQVHVQLSYFCYLEVCIHTDTLYYENKNMSVMVIHFITECAHH
jgi:hypothetical protein